MSDVTTSTASCCPAKLPSAAPVENSLAGFFGHLFDTSSYPPRWQCGSWTELEGWLHIVSDFGIFAAYFAIPCALAYFAWKRRDFPINSVVLLFAAFILLCGTGHLLEAIIFWLPVYRLAGLWKLATAVVSWATFFVLIRLLPTALALPGLATVNEQLRKADAAKSEFLANMSHEIRTPLTAILGYADLIAHGQSDEDRNEAARTIKRNGEHLLAILSEVLDLSKVEAGQLRVDCVLYSPAALVREVVELQQAQAEQKGLKLYAHFATPIPALIETDPVRLRQVLLNLLGNAIKFTDEGSVELRVSVAGEGAQRRLELAVIDTGVGIAAGEHEQLFNAFRQLDSSSTRRHGGTGLGLAISKRLVELLGGDIRVDSQTGQGSTFRVLLPCLSHATVPLTCAPDGFCPSPGAEHAAHERDLCGQRVLLVEDGFDNQRLFSRILSRAGAEVALAENGLAALALVYPADIEGAPQAAARFDLILMDMQMPFMDGYQATEALRARGYTGPILALTAHAMQGDRERCLAVGCDGYLTKPIQRGEFLETIAALTATRVHHV